MSAELENSRGQSATSLMRGIVIDFEHLIEQQFQLTRCEIETEIRQGSAAAAIFAMGIGIVFLAAVVFSLSLTHLLHWAASPAGTDLAWLPLWACDAIVAAVLAVAGVVLTYVGRARFNSIDQCQNPITEIFQEPVR